MKYAYYFFFKLSHKNGKTFVSSRTIAFLIVAPVIIPVVLCHKIYQGLVEFVFEAFNIGLTPNPWIEETEEKFSERPLSNRIFIVHKLHKE